jgi:hypothetical protein
MMRFASAAPACALCAAGGLATLRKDGFTSLGPAPGRQAGTRTAIPVKPGGASQLLLNADCGRAGRIEVERIDPTTGAGLAGVRSDFQVRVRLRGEGTRLHAIEFR